MGLLKRLAHLALLGALVFPQPVKALDFYLSAQGGALSPSDAQIQKSYGTMPKIGIGFGVESDGWGAEINFSDALMSKKVDVSGLTQTADLTNLEFAARFQKAFGKPGQGIRPYFGLDAFYAYSIESIHVNYYGFTLGSASVSASGFGAGVFAGLDFPLTKKLLLNAEVMYDYSKIDGKVDSAKGVKVTPRKGVNSGGFSGSLGLKFFF